MLKIFSPFMRVDLGQLYNFNFIGIINQNFNLKDINMEFNRKIQKKMLVACNFTHFNLQIRDLNKITISNYGDYVRNVL
jgi:hypothetical protein